MSDWVLKHPFKKAPSNWPLDEEGKPVKPVFLQHISGTQLDSDMAVNLLAAYNIPVMRAYPNNGDLGRLVLGFSGTGTDIYVPETVLEDAQNILSADIEDTQEIEEE